MSSTLLTLVRLSMSVMQAGWAGNYIFGAGPWARAAAVQTSPG